MPEPDLSLPPKPPPVANFSSPISSNIPQRSSTTSAPWRVTPSRSVASLYSQNPIRYPAFVPSPTPATYQLSPTPSTWNQTPFSFTPLQGIPSPSILPLGGVTALHNTTPSPQLQSPANDVIAQRGRQRKRDPRMLPSARSPSYRWPRPRLTGKTPPWRINRRKAYVSPNPFQTPEQSRTPLENMTKHNTSHDETMPSTYLQGHSDKISLPNAEYIEAANVAQQQEACEDGTDPIRRLFDLYLDNGVNYLNDEEQELLCSYITPEKEDQRDLVYRLVEQILWYNRLPRLTYRLANWISVRDRNCEVVFRLLNERLNLPDPDEEKRTLMSLEEVDELMDCQIAMDGYKKWVEEGGEEGSGS
ncbi:hypothetical protein F5Y00DRAFT_265942 [Daldinia vernicosa]|uniref:uncharacterized protein n=1 Tax=Daldinia vernicosa TaxID=114800 RepID=UPI0020074705|nr:uncharacterized protein F5Y00DRAFT_265942 [Daldinia vernicosa]KAI0845089.1 hypothetical protein F5Y00DRAFT_265942 [Daldinia vernicosa]